MPRKNMPSPAIALLVTDRQESILGCHSSQQPHATSYTPYGYTPTEYAHLSLLGYNGEPHSTWEAYLLGNGYRAYTPNLMRFNSPDNLSPFAEGGINAYTYCSGEPINNSDPSGHMPGKVKIKNLISQFEGLSSTENPQSKTNTPTATHPHKATQTASSQQHSPTTRQSQTEAKIKPTQEERDQTRLMQLNEMEGDIRDHLRMETRNSARKQLEAELKTINSQQTDILNRPLYEERNRRIREG